VIDLSRQLIEFGEQAARAHFAHLKTGDHLQRGRQIGRVEGFTMEYFIREGTAAGFMRRLLVGPELTPSPAVLVRAACRMQGVMRWAEKPQIVSAGSARDWAAPEPRLLREVLAAIDPPAARPRYAANGRWAEEFADVWNMS
jgi:hypothetical protein